MFNIGVIGCGKIAQVRHLPEYAEHPEAKIYALYDLNMDRAQALAKQYDAKAYDSIEALLADPNVDAVSVCAANNAHAQITIDALNAGKHVLCEKPMAVTLQECENMVSAAEKNGKFLMIGHNQRLAKAHVLAKELVNKGEIGSIISVRSTFGHSGPETWSVDPGANVWFFDKKRAVMGAMADLGIHKTDLIQFLCDGYVQRVTARMMTLDKKYADGSAIGVDDNAFCIYELNNGIVATMNASWTFYGAEDNSTVLYGTQGIMRIYDDPTHSIVVIKKNGDRYLYDVEAIQTNDSQTKSGVIDLWMDCLIQNKAPEISGQEALHAMKAVFAAVESSDSGKTVLI